MDADECCLELFVELHMSHQLVYLNTHLMSYLFSLLH